MSQLVAMSKTPSFKGARVRVMAVTKKPSGEEVWNVTADGTLCTVVTSATSAKAMDEAMVVYSGALKRLAKR